MTFLLLKANTGHHVVAVFLFVRSLFLVPTGMDVHIVVSLVPLFVVVFYNLVVCWCFCHFRQLLIALCTHSNNLLLAASHISLEGPDHLIQVLKNWYIWHHSSPLHGLRVRDLFTNKKHMCLLHLWTNRRTHLQRRRESWRRWGCKDGRGMGFSPYFKIHCSCPSNTLCEKTAF